MSFHPMSDAEFARLETKGRDLFAAMVEGARSNAYVPVREVSRPDGGYHTVLYDAAELDWGTNIRNVVASLGVPVDGYVAAEVCNVPGGDVEQAPYLNHVHKDGTAILCWHNFAASDILGERRAYWSDLMAVSCSRVMARENATQSPPGPRRDMTGLLAIVRLNIVNQTTVDLVDYLLSQDPRPAEELRFRAGEAGFFALLGAPNGKGAARMLATYPRMFGRKVITSAVVTHRGNPNIYWMLEVCDDPPAPPETPPPPPETPRPMSHRAARRQRRSGRHERTV